jgi:hypothetical protein
MMENKKTFGNMPSFNEFSDFYIFPHEFLCLSANSHNRDEIMKTVYKPNWEVLK